MHEHARARHERRVASYLNESFSVAARAWKAKVVRGDVAFCVPSLHYWEFANVLRTYARREVASDPKTEINDMHLDAPLHVVEPDRRQTLARALEYEATVYDAVYIELCPSLDAPLGTAEKTTTPWVRRLGRRARVVA